MCFELNENFVVRASWQQQLDAAKGQTVYAGSFAKFVATHGFCDCSGITPLDTWTMCLPARPACIYQRLPKAGSTVQGSSQNRCRKAEIGVC